MHHVRALRVSSVSRWRVPLASRRRALCSSRKGEESISASSALRQQLEFCCLVCGWDVPCTTCPFKWYGFDGKTRYRVSRDAASTPLRVAAAIQILHVPLDSGANMTRQTLKEAFRRQALQWHPDCNKDPDAETRFKAILDAYEYLLALTP
ncbi:hypothetical protein Poli38472_007638 [Pythium oligandrum]|uniref:J domain-containing protein n=1 Tax=Pythium oligandrum TaxID=41045 RepID=A0A8K1FM84_PYTOL|nr:hypothetical protein Poli38472_007638 [Pythium oligandrum]|eukprot:TMW67966.1 hypothetical protein Poli38472_007638 [Pythium oligandrum]